MSIFNGTTRPALRFFDATPEDVYTGADVIEWSLMRGRRKKYETLQPAALRVQFDNRAATYDAISGNGPWWFEWILPDTSIVQVFEGRLNAVQQYRNLTPSTLIEVLDEVHYLRRSQITPAYLNANGSETVDDRATRIATDYGWYGYTAATYPSSVVMLASFGNMDAATAMQQCANAAGGNFYTRIDGQIQISDPAERLARTTVLAFSDAGTADTVPFTQAVMSPASEHIVNAVTVSRPSRGTGAGQATKATYTVATGVGAMVWEAPVASDTTAQALACYLARVDATPSETVAELEFSGVDFLRNASTLTYNTLAALEIGDKITVTRSGTTYTCVVEGIKHSGTTRDWRVRLYLSEHNSYSVDLINGLGTTPGSGTFVYATPANWTIDAAVDTVRAATSLDVKWRDFSDRGAATGTLELYANAKQEVVYDSNSTGAYQFDCKGGSATAMTTTMDMGQCVEFDVLVKCNNSAHYANSTVLVDGSSTGVTTIWLGGAPASGTVGGWDRYKLKVYQVNNTPTFRVVAQRTTT